jgi:hypothetical protein
MMIPNAITPPTIPPTIAPTGGGEDTGFAIVATCVGLNAGTAVVRHIVVTTDISATACVIGWILVLVTVTVTVFSHAV